MLAFGKWLYEKYNRPPKTYEEEFERIRAKYERRYNEIGESTDEEGEEGEHKKLVNIAPNQLFERHGLITELTNTDGRIDNQYLFSLVDSKNLHLHVGCEVVYLARKIADDESIRIIEIQSIVTDSWNNDNYNVVDALEDLKMSNPQLFEHRERVLRGCIVQKTGAKIIFKLNEYPDEIEVNIDHVKTNFQPMKGDDICAYASVQTDETKAGCLGAILDFKKITPLKLESIEGEILKAPNVDDNYGLIDDDYLFYANALDNAENHERRPVLGDKIIAEAISGSYKLDYREFNWRCIKIIHHDERNEQSFVGNIDAYVDNDSKGIYVTPSAQLTVSLYKINEEKKLSVEIKNQTGTMRQLMKIELLDPNSTIEIMHGADFNYKLDPDTAFVVTMMVTGRSFGKTYDHIKFTFDIGDPVIRLVITTVDGQLKLQGDTDSFYISEKNYQYTRSMMKRTANVMRGEKVRNTPNFLEIKLKPFEVPKTLAEIVFSSHIISLVEEELTSVLPSFAVFAPNNYKSCFHNLLYLEELQQIHSMRKYDRDQAYFLPEGEYLSLEMQNILETRPSLIVGDSLRANQPGDNNDYEGIIHRIERNKIYLKFHPEFHAQYRLNRGDFKIVFRASRATYIKQHNALEAITRSSVLVNNILFPEKIGPCGTAQFKVQMNAEGNFVSGNRIFKVFNPTLNEVQKVAVLNVLQGKAGLPYVIFGPPGTGKTSTIVELILQIYKNLRHSVLLIATPSNSAANLITQRIIDSGILVEGEFLRIVGHNALSRGLVSESLQPYCAMIDIAAAGTGCGNLFTNNYNVKQYGSNELRTQRVMIGTCNALGALLQLNLPKNLFTHVIVDEAGQCMEPEIAIPLSRVSTTGQVILAGDPMQLGPIVLSKLAKARGLDNSYLSRLLDQPPYARDTDRFPKTNGYDPRLVTKLLYNYRSLPKILSFYSRHFYDDELIPTVNETDSTELKLLNRLISADVLQASEPPNHGIYFYAIRGDDEQVPNSPSWCNLAEASSVIIFAEQLFQAKVALSEIGIITPYQLQAKKIRDHFEVIFGADVAPKVGSVEEFQGQERMVVLISTVRSTSVEAQNDVKCNAGFVKSARRLNVAVSRARAVVVVFGNPDLLEEDEHWKNLIYECKENGTFVGSERRLFQY